jgi:flagellar hook-length control protein FliK
MPSPPPQAVAPTSASFVKGYAKRDTGQPPFAGLLDRLTDHPSFQDRPVLPAVPHARSDDPSRRFDAASVHAPANRDLASAADSRPVNESSAGSRGGADQPSAAPHAITSGQSADRSAKDTPAHEGSTVSSTADAKGQTAAAAAPSAQGPAAAAPVDTTGIQAVAALISPAGGGDAAAGTAGAASAGKGDNLAISGAKTPQSPSDLALRPTIAAGAAGAGMSAGQTPAAGAADEDADPPGDTPTSNGALPNANAPAPGQLAEPPAVETDPADATAQSASGRLVSDGDSTIADRPHATAATANPTAALGTPSVSHGTSAAAPAENRATAVPLSEIAVTIAAQARSGNSRFDIRLDPPELGRIDVQLNVDRSGNVSSRLIVERPETLDLIRRDALQLERALQDAGLNTGNGMQFSLADQGFANRNWLIDHAAGAPLVAAVDEPVASANAYAAAAGHRGGLDITV